MFRFFVMLAVFYIPHEANTATNFLRRIAFFEDSPSGSYLVNASRPHNAKNPLKNIGIDVGSLVILKNVYAKRICT